VEDHSQGWRLRHPKDAPLGAPLTVIFAQRENARREEDGPASSRGRGHRGVRCYGNCLPADAGLLAWWRRRAQRAPARQGAACRPPGVGAVPADPAPALARFPRQLTLSLGGSRVFAAELAGAGRLGAPQACP
jgi:hypothetical protein